MNFIQFSSDQYEYDYDLTSEYWVVRFTCWIIIHKISFFPLALLRITKKHEINVSQIKVKLY